MDLQNLIPIIGIFITVFIAIAGYNIAKRRNRNGWLWFVICLFTGLLGLIVVAYSKTLDYDEDLDVYDTDVLGWIMLVIAILWLILNIYWGYKFAEARHNQMIWDFTMQLLNR